jgi:aminoglycoside phosphotransferase (APT) family kinase protein
MAPSHPPAAGVRIRWRDVPAHVRAGVELRLGAGVSQARSQRGGFSPGAAARVRLTDGRRAFVKAAGAAPNPDSPAMHRREGEVAAALPRAVPAPRLLGTYDDGDWVALMFEDVAGRQPRLPWRRAELDRVLDLLAGLARTLTPSPLALASVAERHGDEWSGFRDLAAARAGGDPLDDLDPWIADNLARLAALEATWPLAAAGETLVHVDIRADNLLIAGERTYVVDWPHAAVGAAWIDLLVMLPSVAMQGGPDPAAVFAAHPAARRADPAAVTAVLCALTGLFVAHGRLPDPPGLPTLRAFQAAQGTHATRWLRQRTGWR